MHRDGALNMAWEQSRRCTQTWMPDSFKNATGVERVRAVSGMCAVCPKQVNKVTNSPVQRATRRPGSPVSHRTGFGSLRGPWQVLLGGGLLLPKLQQG